MKKRKNKKHTFNKKELSRREQEVQDKIKDLKKQNNDDRLNSLISRKELSVALVEAKIEFPKVFYTIVNEEIASKKFIQRTMKLALDNSVDFKKAMCIKGGKHDIENCVSLLKLDERITNLTVDKLKDFNEPTLKKLEEIKNLSDDDFNKVISGLDKPYIDYKNEISKEKEDEREKARYSKKPNGMKDEEFDAYCKGGIYTVITALSELKKENQEIRSELELKSSELDDLNKEFQDIVLGKKTQFKINSEIINNNSVSQEAVS